MEKDYVDYNTLAASIAGAGLGGLAGMATAPSASLFGYQLWGDPTAAK